MATLKELRKRSHLTQEALAKVTKIPQESISRFENGRRKPGPKSLSALAGALGVDPKQIQFTKEQQADFLSMAPKRAVSAGERLTRLRLALDNEIRELLPGISENNIRKFFGQRKIADYVLKILSGTPSKPPK